jgi:hypothetical protein
MSAIYNRDRSHPFEDLDTVRRTLALADAITHCRRAAFAAEAACAGEPDTRRGLLNDAHRRLRNVAAELEALE